MEYKRDKNQWQGIFTATGAGTINIQMNGTGKLYDLSLIHISSLPPVYKLPYRFHARKISPGRFWKRPKVEYQRRTLSPL